LYAELTGGFILRDAVERAQKKVSTHQVILLGDDTISFENLSGGKPFLYRGHPKGNLPAQTGIFLGRGRELAEISKSLSHPPALVVLSGPPGIGKSRLVLEAAYRNAWRFPGGVAYAAGPRPEHHRQVIAAEMLAVLADALGLEQTEDLPEYLATNPTLLLLDNLESLQPNEMTMLKEFLQQMGGESAALLALRPSSEILEELSIFQLLPIHSGLGLEEAARYAISLANKCKIPLTWDRACLIADAVEGILCW
jgi:hypothetical protein